MITVIVGRTHGEPILDWPHAHGAHRRTEGREEARLTGPSGEDVEDHDVASMLKPLLQQLRDRAVLTMGPRTKICLTPRKTRPARKDGFRMERHLSLANSGKVYLSADSVTIALRASGDLS
jgi:hypothetical protein